MQALARFDDFFTFGDPQLVQMKAAAKAFVRDMVERRSPRWLTLLGTPATGKTMLARIINGIFRDNIEGSIESETSTAIRRYSGGFITWNRLSTLLREGEFRMFDDICGHQFVALDDIGSEYASDYTRAKLYEFLNRSEGKWRVITGNLSLLEIGERLDFRISSRMLRHGSTVIEVDAPDFSLREKEKQP
jgi:DNA replication protein